MSVITLFVAAALAAAGTSSPTAAQAAKPDPVTLSFNLANQNLAGVLYGIEAIDASPQTFGKLVNTELVAGRRTIWYSCPTGSRSSLTYDFSAGGKYELVCNPGQDAEIRRIDEC